MFWLIAEVFVFIAGAILALIVYLQDTHDIKALGAFISVFLLGIGIARRAKENEKGKINYRVANKLAEFIDAGNELAARSDEIPLPIQDHNKWVESIDSYLKSNGKPHWAVKLNDFSGYTFFGDGSEKSKYKNSIEGRKRRLHEFINQLDV